MTFPDTLTSMGSRVPSQRPTDGMGLGSGNPLPADAEYPAEPDRRGNGRLAATRKQSARTEQEFQSLSDQIGSRRDPDIEWLDVRLAQLEQSLAAITDRLDRFEQHVAALAEQASESQNRVEADIRRNENQLAEHTAVLESYRTAVAQTDDLVERVVEALESLQSTVLDQPAAGAVGVN